MKTALLHFSVTISLVLLNVGQARAIETANSSGAYNASDIANHGSNNQVALFFGKSGECQSATANPAAALTVHSSMPTESLTTASEQTPTLVSATRVSDDVKDSTGPGILTASAGPELVHAAPDAAIPAVVSKVDKSRQAH